MTQKNEAKDINPTFRNNILLAHNMRQTEFFYMLPDGPKMHILFSFVPKGNNFLPRSWIQMNLLDIVFIMI